MMYHIGKVENVIGTKKQIISADDVVQVVVRMWDENLLMLPIEKKLCEEVKEGDYVIADYSPLKAESPHRKMVVVKILRGKDGKSIFENFQREYQERKRKVESVHPPPMPYIR
jgi:SepF-like predicted cell division protein (DUF552 family)